MHLDGSTLSVSHSVPSALLFAGDTGPELKKNLSEKQTSLKTCRQPHRDPSPVCHLSNKCHFCDLGISAVSGTRVCVYSLLSAGPCEIKIMCRLKGPDLWAWQTRGLQLDLEQTGFFSSILSFTHQRVSRRLPHPDVGNGKVFNKWSQSRSSCCGHASEQHSHRHKQSQYPDKYLTEWSKHYYTL